MKPVSLDIRSDITTIVHALPGSPGSNRPANADDTAASLRGLEAAVQRAVEQLDRGYQRYPARYVDKTLHILRGAMTEYGGNDGNGT